MVRNPTTGQSLQPRVLPFIGAGRTRRGYALDRLWVMKLAMEPQSFGNEAGYGEQFPTLVTRTLWAGWIGVLFDEAVEGYCHHYFYGSIIRRAELFNTWWQEHRHEAGVLRQSLFYLVAITSWLTMQGVALSDITVSNVGRDPMSGSLPRAMFFDTAEWTTLQEERYKISCGLVRLLEKYDEELLATIRALGNMVMQGQEQNRSFMGLFQSVSIEQQRQSEELKEAVTHLGSRKEAPTGWTKFIPRPDPFKPKDRGRVDSMARLELELQAVGPCNKP